VCCPFHGTKIEQTDDADKGDGSCRLGRRTANRTRPQPDPVAPSAVVRPPATCVTMEPEAEATPVAQRNILSISRISEHGTGPTPAPPAPIGGFGAPSVAPGSVSLGQRKQEVKCTLHQEYIQPQTDQGVEATADEGNDSGRSFPAKGSRDGSYHRQAKNPPG
jgi:hypothetical protein